MKTLLKESVIGAVALSYICWTCIFMLKFDDKIAAWQISYFSVEALTTAYFIFIVKQIVERRLTKALLMSIIFFKLFFALYQIQLFPIHLKEWIDLMNNSKLGAIFCILIGLFYFLCLILFFRKKKL